MRLRERVVNALFADLVKDQVEARLAAAEEVRAEPRRIAAASSSALMAPTAEDAKWRKLTGNVERELLPVAQDRMIEIAYWLYETNPLAGWLVNVTTAFILAEGIPYETKHPDVKAVLDGFWHDPVNRMPLNFPRHVDELQIFGELCFPVFTAAQTGRTRYGYVDPANIEAVITDPENVRLSIGLLTKGWTGQIGGFTVASEPKRYRIVLPEEADYVMSSVAKQLREQFDDGECFYWAINNVTNSPRGRSSLLAVADWLDVYEQFLYDYSDKWPQFNSFVWGLTITGGDDAAIDKELKKFIKKSGSVFGHNENVKLEAIMPDLKADDASVGARLFRNHILGRFGFPEHWYGGGGDVNRATASEMDAPALKILSQKQLTVKYIMEDMLSYQVRRARAARYLRVTDEEAAFTIRLPEMGTKDIAKLASAAQATCTAIATAEVNGWVDTDTARKVFASVVSFTGVDMDFDAIRAAVEQQKVDAGNEDYLRKAREDAERQRGDTANPEGEG